MQQYFGTTNPVVLSSSPPTPPSPSPMELSHSTKLIQYYLKMYQQLDKLKPTKVKRLVQQGIPKQVRWMFWLKLSGASLLQKSHPNLFQELLCQSTDDAEQIKKDIPRTFPNLKEFTTITLRMKWERQSHKLIGDEFEQNNQQKLYNVCKALSIYMKQSEIGFYVQGLSFICGYFLMHLSEEDTFWICVQLLSKYDFKSMYQDGFPKLSACITVLQQLITKSHPSLLLLLQKNGLDLNLLTHKWFLTLFCLQFPFEFLDSFWDMFFVQGWKFVFKVVMQLIQCNVEQVNQIAREVTHMDEQNSYLIDLFHNTIPTQFDSTTTVHHFMKKVYATKLSEKPFKSFTL